MVNNGIKNYTSFVAMEFETGAYWYSHNQNQKLPDKRA